MGRLRRLGVAAALVVVAVGVAVAVLRGGNSDRGSKQAEDSATVALMRSIEARAEHLYANGVPSATVRQVAAPGGAPRRHESASNAVPVAADGFSFASVVGELPKDRLGAGERRRRFVTATAEVREWLGDPNAASDLTSRAAAAGRDWTYGWIELRPDSRWPAARLALSQNGVDVLGVTGNLVRAKLPAAPVLLSAIQGMADVVGIGHVPARRKIAEALRVDMSGVAQSGQVPVFITLMDDDTDGRWRSELERLGAVVADFHSGIRAYAAVVDRSDLRAFAVVDFVLAIEPVTMVESVHASAVPAMGADALRTYGGTPGLFAGVGGRSVPIGVMDTGLNVSHLDIVSSRQSICGMNFVAFLGASEDLDLWVDEDGHGTHVTGTIAGNGYGDPVQAGMAPLVQHIRFAKVLSSFGFGFASDIMRGMDWLAEASSCDDVSDPDAAVKPLVVNMSLGSSSRVFEGRGADARKLDATVWHHRQLYVVANANSGNSGFSNLGAAKNSLAVGAAEDAGELATFSSVGPTADGRLLPQVVGTGVELNSAKGNGASFGYKSSSGTSMASPAVAGVAALLMDVRPSYRERPALVRARLMASAIKPDVWFGDAERFPPSNTDGPGTLQHRYGLGKVSARTSILNRDLPDGWVSGGGYADLTDGEYAYYDIAVPANASRLDVVMTWDEPPADAVASPVLNDLDLWLDEGADCESVACGEYSSTSRIDNVEWVVVRNPTPGVYRAKVAANRVYTGAPLAAMAWTVVRGASTPMMHVDASATLEGGTGELAFSVVSDSYVAAGTRLHLDCRGADDACGSFYLAEDAAVSREDGLTRTGAEGWGFGLTVDLGEVAAGETQTVRLPFDYYGEAVVRLYATVDAWNAMSATDFVDVVPTDGEGASALPNAVLDYQAPDNDDFAYPVPITGSDGVVALDLLLGTSEPGEPTRFHMYEGATPIRLNVVRVACTGVGGVSVLGGNCRQPQPGCRQRVLGCVQGCADRWLGPRGLGSMGRGAFRGKGIRLWRSR